MSACGSTTTCFSLCCTCVRKPYKVLRKWDQAKTPYERLLDSAVLSPEQQARLHHLYEHTNPVQLRKAIYLQLDALWRAATALPGSVA